MIRVLHFAIGLMSWLMLTALYVLAAPANAFTVIMAGYAPRQRDEPQSVATESAVIFDLASYRLAGADKTEGSA